MNERKNYMSIVLLTGILILNFIGVSNAADNNSAINEVARGLSG